MGVPEYTHDDNDDKESAFGIPSDWNVEPLLFPCLCEVGIIRVVKKDGQDIMCTQDENIVFQLVIHKAEIFQGMLLPICKERIRGRRDEQKT